MEKFKDEVSGKMLVTSAYLEQRGFTSEKHIINGNVWKFDLGRLRHIIVASVGTPNELVLLAYFPKDELNMVVDPPEIVCISNFDYDGSMTVEKLDALLKAFGK